jgi:hypothetical protein
MNDDRMIGETWGKFKSDGQMLAKWTEVKVNHLQSEDDTFEKPNHAHSESFSFHLSDQRIVDLRRNTKHCQMITSSRNTGRNRDIPQPTVKSREESLAFSSQIELSLSHNLILPFVDPNFLPYSTRVRQMHSDMASKITRVI